MNRRAPLSHFLLLGMILSTNTFPDQSSRYRPMAESMFDMMDAFSSTFQKRVKERDNDWTRRLPGHSSWLNNLPAWSSGGLPLNPGGMPMSPAIMPWGPDSMNYMPGSRTVSPGNPLPSFNWRPTESGPLDGVWIDSAGNILSVKNDRFRISQSSDRYKEGYLLLETGNMLSMRTRNSNHKRYYEYAVHDDKLVLRDPSGNLLLFRQKNSWEWAK
ncbi:MAG: hypothetical protein GY792_19280 [Gammaproteobacteria bacterium]|nr:hypothetical protein [Gammaproteobacteria bacterium]